LQKSNDLLIVVDLRNFLQVQDIASLANSTRTVLMSISHPKSTDYEVFDRLANVKHSTSSADTLLLTLYYTLDCKT
jgi:hypothetical protein